MLRRFIKTKPPAHIRGWGIGKRHSEPFAKRNTTRRAERRFVIQSKQESKHVLDG